MEKINRSQIIESFKDLLCSLSDKKHQKWAWIEGNEADFDEFVCIFLDIGDAILDSYKDFDIKEDQYSLLLKLRDRFRQFSLENDFPGKFIDTPEWESITTMAKELLEAFDRKEIKDRPS